VKSGALGLAQRFQSSAAVVLMYHSVLDDPRECADSIGIESIHSTDNFRKQMEILARYCNVVTLDDIRLYLTKDRAMPRRPVAVTFDDGYADNAEIAAPVLDRLGIQASFYVTVEAVDTGRSPWFCPLRHAFTTAGRQTWSDSTGRIWDLNDVGQRESAIEEASGHLTRLAGSAQHGALQALERDLEPEPFSPRRPLMMTWEQARGLRRGGHVVGSHSLTHPNMAHIADDVLRRELTESKRKIETELAMPVVHFSYPAAALRVSWTQQTVAASAQAGYQTAVTTTNGVVTRTSNPLSLCRLGAPSDLEEFRWMVQSAVLKFS